jgi:hypothetical protein
MKGGAVLYHWEPPPGSYKTLTLIPTRAGWFYSKLAKPFSVGKVLPGTV